MFPLNRLITPLWVYRWLRFDDYAAAKLGVHTHPFVQLGLMSLALRSPSDNCIDYPFKI